jgi:hypothetical protein
MTPPVRPRLALLAVALLAVAGAGWVALQRPLPVEGPAPADGYTRLPGVVHVHTALSDGGGSPEEVVAAARRSGLRFLAITDHNNLDAKPMEGERDGLLVIVGVEVSTIAGHIVGLGIPDPAFRFSGDPADALDDIRELGGHAFAAHPLNARSDFLYGAWDLPGPWGMELLNGDSQWREAGWLALLRTGALYALNSRYALLGSLSPPEAALARWDQLLARRDVAGIAGADAHSRVPLSRKRGLRFPSYESLFALVRNYVLLEQPLSGDFARDSRVVIEALARGRSYLGVDGIAPAPAFSFVAEAGGRRWTMGDTVVDGLPRLRAGGAMPRGALVRLLKDGRPVIESEGPLDTFATGTGVYRVEVRVPGRALPWILTNPIYVFPPAAAEERRRAGEWPAATAPAAAAVLDDFEGEPRFAAEFDASSEMNREAVEAGAGVNGSRAARLEFRLGEPGEGRPYTWCALVNRERRDLSGRKGLVFSIKADGVYRSWVQVRDANPASEDAGEEWWFASVRTSREWRRVAIPFERLRTLNKKSDGRLDLDRVRGLVFVLDHAAVKPGTRGRIWIDDLGVY